MQTPSTVYKPEEDITFDKVMEKKKFWKRHKNDIIKYAKIVVPCVIIAVSLMTGSDILELLF